MVDVDTKAGWFTFSIWSASRRSLASLRLGLNVSISSSVLTDASCLEFTSSLVVICEHKKSVRTAADAGGRAAER